MKMKDNYWDNEDIKEVMHRKKAHIEEYQETYNNLRTKQTTNKKRKYSKSKLKKKKAQQSRKNIMIASMLLIGLIAAGHHHCERVIADDVYRSGVLEGIGVTDSAVSGHVFTYTNQYGQTSQINSEHAIDMIMERGTEQGYDANEMAIALDYMRICPASEIENSTLLQRLAKEGSVLAGTWNLDEQIEDAIGGKSL